MSWTPPPWFGAEERSDFVALRNAYNGTLATLQRLAEAASNEREYFGVRSRLSMLRHSAEADLTALSKPTVVEQRQMAREEA